MKNPSRAFLCILLAALFTSGIITVFLGAIPMHVSWRLLGRAQYYLCYLGLSLFAVQVGFTEWGGLLAALSILVGLNNEALERGLSHFLSAFLSMSVLFGLFSIALGLFSMTSEVFIFEELQRLIETAMSQLKFSQENLGQLSAADIVAQLPSVFILLLGFTLAVTLFFEKRVFTWVGAPVPERKPLNTFQVPNAVIWVFIASLLGVFLTDSSSTIKQISVNIFNISIFCYLLQGLAIFSQFLNTFKLASYWRWLIIITLVIYLHTLLSLIGLLDFWMDFRKRLSKKKATQIKKRREL